MRILSWNCRRADKSNFFRNLYELVVMYKPYFLVILEPCIPSKVARIVSTCRCDGFFVVDARGFFGGIWYFWKKNVFDVEVLESKD